MADVNLNARASHRLDNAETAEHGETYALCVDGQVEAYFASNGEALSAALERHALGEFSVVRIEPQSPNVGIFGL